MKRILFSLFFLFIAVSTLKSQNFSSQGFYISNNGNMIDCAAAQPDGNFLLAGSFHRYGKIPVGNLIRLKPNGTLDTAFNSIGGTDRTIYHMAVHPNGSIILAGNFTRYGKTPVQSALIRLLPDGRYDPTFQSELSPYYVGAVTAVCATGDGKVLVAGFGVLPGIPFDSAMVVRFNKDGSLDNSFGRHIADQFIKGIELQPDSSVIVYGDFLKWNGSAVPGIVRLNPDGSVDQQFESAISGLLGTNGYLLSVACAKVLQDSCLLVAGQFNDNNVWDKRTIKLNRDGTIDPTFVMDPAIDILWIDNAAQLSDGGIALGGTMYVNGDYQWFAKLKPDGQLFSPNSFVGPERDQEVFGTKGIFPIPNGEFFAAGFFSGKVAGTRLGILNRFDANAQPYFNDPFPLRKKGNIVETAVDTAHRIIVVGAFNQYGDTVNPQTRNYIARLLPDGKLDPSFSDSGANSYINSVAIQKNGQIVVAGSFSKLNGKAFNKVGRFNEDGEPDLQFNPGSGPDDINMYDIHVSDDQHIYAAGSFRNFDNSPHKGIVRLNPDGSVDNGFNPNIPELYGAASITTTQDGSVIFGDGSIRTTMYFDQPMRVVKVDPNGTPDVGFSPPVLDYPVTQKIALGNDGSIYWNGTIYHDNNQPTYPSHPIIRMHADGSLDTVAYRNMPQDHYVKTFDILPNGKVVIVTQNPGDYDSLDVVMRLNPDLSIDSSFVPVALLYHLNHINHDGNDRIIIAGEPKQNFRFENEQIQNIAIITKNGMEVQANDSTIRNMLDTANFTAKVVDGYAEQQFTITNQSNATMELLDAGMGKISGEQSADFSIITNTNTRSLQPKASLQFTLRFKPSSGDQKNIQIQIPFTDGIQQVYIVPVRTAVVIDSTQTPVNDSIPHPNLFPNPARTSAVTVRSDVAIDSYEIFDMNGHRIQSGPLQGSGTYTINLKEGTRGLIIVKLKSGKKEFVQRVMKL